MWILPNYTESLIIFRIIFPGLAIGTCVTVIMHNYYKVLGKSFDFFLKSLLVLVVSAVTDGIAYYMFKTTSSISAASILTMIFWYVFMERYLVKKYNCGRWKNISYMLVLMLVFYSIAIIDNMIIEFFVYWGAYVIATLVIQKQIVNTVKQKLKKK